MRRNEDSSIWVKILLYLVVADILVILLAIGGRMLLDWQPLSAFYPFFYAAQFGLVLAMLALLQTLTGLFRKRKAHIKSGLTAMVLALLPVLFSLLAVGVSGFRAPMIHDITTDLDDPPVYTIISSLRTAEDNSLEHGGESIALEQRQAYPDISPLFSTMDPGAAQNRALQVVKSLGWIVVMSDDSLGQIEAYEKSKVFGFIDDVVIRIRPAEQGSRIDLRSVSRVGLGDLGANAERIRRFYRAFSL